MHYRERRVFPNACLEATPEQFAEFAMGCKRTIIDMPIGDKIIIDTGLVVKRTAETSYTLYAFSEKIVYNDYAGLYLPEDLSLAIERINRESLGEVSLIDF